MGRLQGVAAGRYFGLVKGRTKRCQHDLWANWLCDLMKACESELDPGHACGF